MLTRIDYFYLTNLLSLYPKRIVITGGPGTGKTSVIHALEAAGHHCFHEVIRSMTFNAKNEGDPDTFMSNPLTFVPDPLLFNRKIMAARKSDFALASEMKQAVVFYDRGMPDVLAYMDYFGQEYDGEFTSSCMEYRYDKVFILPPWEAIYVSDNERLESFAEALEIHHYLSRSYERYGYDPVSIPEGTVGERAARILIDLTRENYL
jgi:predicted ATPase